MNTRPRFSWCLPPHDISPNRAESPRSDARIRSRSCTPARCDGALGIRAALGASSIDLAALVYRGGLALVAAGMALGSAAAVGAQRFIASQMYGVSIMDGLTWIAVLAVVAVMGLIASALPAWQAARHSPVEALRSE